MKHVNIIFPHQLFQDSPIFETSAPCFLVEEFLFFNQYSFHKQKIAFHRASMKAYQTDLEINGATVHYVEAHQPHHDIRVLITNLANQGTQQIRIIDPTDTYLSQHIRSSCRTHQIELNQIESPLFLNTTEQNKTFFKSTKKKFHQSERF